MGTALKGQPAEKSLAFWLFVTSTMVTVWRPIAAVYVITFFALAGDSVTAIWYPFSKNLSSHESLLFLDPHLSASPLECLLALALIVWIVQLVARRERFIFGTLFGPVMAFGGFVVFGLVRSAVSGADLNVALWEARTLLYIPIVYVLTTNLFTRKAHYDALFWVISVAILVDSMIAIAYYLGLSTSSRSGLESLGEHPASLHADLLFVVLIAAWVLPKSSVSRRVALVPLAVPVFIVYLIAHRRAAVVGLAAGIVVLALTLFWTRRRRFWVIVPIFSLAALGYLGAFWNTQGLIGFPAQSVKAVVYPNQVSAADQSSDFYRKVESADVVATIRASPLKGIGFGQRFFRPFPLPDLSFWVFSDYITHNGILWIWMKLGVGGFVAMLYLLAASTREGARATIALPLDDSAVLTVSATAFVIMFAIFSYVDIGWDGQSVVCLGAFFALIGNMERLHAVASPTPSETR